MYTSSNIRTVWNPEEANRVAAAVSRPDPEITFPIPDPKKLDHELEDSSDLEATELFDFAE